MLARNKAEAFLLEKLVGGAPVETNDLLEEAKANGISARTLRRAKARLSIKAVKQSLTSGWAWKWQPSTRTD